MEACLSLSRLLIESPKITEYKRKENANYIDKPTIFFSLPCGFEDRFLSRFS